MTFLKESTTRCECSIKITGHNERDYGIDEIKLFPVTCFNEDKVVLERMDENYMTTWKFG